MTNKQSGAARTSAEKTWRRMSAAELKYYDRRNDVERLYIGRHDVAVQWDREIGGPVFIIKRLADGENVPYGWRSACSVLNCDKATPKLDARQPNRDDDDFLITDYPIMSGEDLQRAHDRLNFYQSAIAMFDSSLDGYVKVVYDSNSTAQIRQRNWWDN